MRRVRDWLSWGAARLGWPGLAGLALLAASFLTCMMLVRPMEQMAHALQVEARALAVRSAAAPVQVRDWRADLPAGHEAYARLRRLFQAAEAAGLALDEGSYRSQADAGGISRLVISLPVSGTYPAIRAFLAQALNQDPALALESLRLTRESMNETELSAELRFALYLGGGR